MGHTLRRLFAHLRACPREALFTERPLQEQRNEQVLFPFPTPQHKHRANYRNQPSTDTCYLTCLYQAHCNTPLTPPPSTPLPHFDGTALPSQIASVPGQQIPSPRRIAQPPTKTLSHNLGVLWSLSSNGDVDRFHFTSRPEHT